MKRKFFAILIAVIILLASCGFDAIVTPYRGYWDGDTFVSAYFGLRFDLPDNWAAATENDLAEMLIDGDVMPVAPGGRITRDNFIGFEVDIFPDMAAFFGDTWGIAYSAVLMGIEWIPGDVPFSEIRFLQEKIMEAEAMSDDAFIVEFVINEGVVRIGDYDWHSADILLINNVNQRVFVRVDVNFAKLVRIIYRDIDEMHKILGHFGPY